MKIGAGAHLTYCMNIHPGETWSEQAAALNECVPKIQCALTGSGPFGVGLRVSDHASRELLNPETLAELKQQLAGHGQYVFTINGFPFGTFHRTRVKEQVYAPDWSCPERAAYTRRLADLLVALEPPDREASISTVPGGYRATIDGDAKRIEAMVRQLMEMVGYLADLEARTGHCIHLGLEPEPDCLIETTDEAIHFFEDCLIRIGTSWLMHQSGASAAQAEGWIRRYLGVCLDTCHAALQFEDPVTAWKQYEQAGIRVSKIQLSAALQGENQAALRQALEPFDEPVYLHQTRWRDPVGNVYGAPDLPSAMDHLAHVPDGWPVRVHFHVPLFWAGSDPLQTTRHTLTPEFWTLLQQSPGCHVEIETYTFDVLPAPLQAPSVTANIIQEFEWVNEQLGNVG